MLPDRVSNPGPLTYESGALPIALHGPANCYFILVDNSVFEQHDTYIRFWSHFLDLTTYLNGKFLISKFMMFNKMHFDTKV